MSDDSDEEDRQPWHAGEEDARLVKAEALSTLELAKQVPRNRVRDPAHYTGPWAATQSHRCGGSGAGDSAGAAAPFIRDVRILTLRGGGLRWKAAAAARSQQPAAAVSCSQHPKASRRRRQNA